jgi:IS1 family transposase
MIQRLAVAADALARVVQKQANQPWIGMARHAQPRQGIAVHGGDRRRPSAKPLWAKMPVASRQHATCSPAQYVVYAGVMPVAQHRAISQVARNTNPSERFNHTLRQRVPRLVREALSFAKQRATHLGAITLFICPSNLRKAPALHG